MYGVKGASPRSTVRVAVKTDFSQDRAISHPTTIFTARSWWSNTRRERKFVQICQKIACLNQNLPRKNLPTNKTNPCLGQARAARATPHFVCTVQSLGLHV